MNKFMTRILSCVLTLAMLISFAPAAVAVDKTVKPVFTSRLNFDVADSESVTAIVVFDGESGAEMVKKGLVKDIPAARKKVTKRQATVKAEIVNKYDAEVIYSYDTLLNGVSVRTTYGNLKEIEKMDGISKVYLANKYSAPKTELVPKASSAAEIMVLNNESIIDAGSGTVIAVIDTSFNVNHQVFTYTNGLSPKLTKEDVENTKGLNGQGVYASAKFPFVYDYYDGDTDVFSTADHGTAVASIAAGYNGDDFYGTAPFAQILGMKVFPDDGSGTDSGVYFAALEDAYLLGADVINMSLGSQNGFTFDYELESEVYGNIYKTLKDNGVFVICAAGNEYSNGYYNYTTPSMLYGMEAVTPDYTDYGVVGTPSTYSDVISVSSIENPFYLANAITVGTANFEYVDSSVELADNFYGKFAGQTLDYVMIPGVGNVSDFAGIDVTGKVAVIKRGSIDFADKLENAAKAGAIAMICYNNEEGMLAMTIDSFPIPAIFISQEAGAAFEAATTKKFIVQLEQMVFENVNSMKPSDFSSWGCTPDLKLKPEISGIGGMVTCADCLTFDGYVSMSGTSMAAPTVAGLIASFLSVAGYGDIRKDELVDEVMDTLYSYAWICADDYAPFSPRKQGAGLATLDFITGEYVFIRDPIANLGDDPEKSGVFTYTTTIVGKPNTVVTPVHACALTDAIENFSEDDSDYYNILLSEYLSDAAITFDKESYVVGADGTVDMTVTITLGEESKAYLELFPNGSFVEGYVAFDVNDEYSDLHLTFMGYYGDWTQAPVFEAYDWGEFLNIMYLLDTTVGDEKTGETFTQLGYTPYDFLTMNVGYNEAYTGYFEYDEEYEMYLPTIYYYLGGNPYVSAPFDEKYMAFSTPLTDADYVSSEMFIMYPSMLRNARHVIMTVSDAKTGEVYFVDDTEYALKNYYDYDSNMYAQYTLFYWDGTYLDEAGEWQYVPNGTVVDVVFETQLDYPGAELEVEREYQITVDYKAPEASADLNLDNNTLTITASDNHYMSSYYVYYYDADLEDYVGLTIGEIVSNPNENSVTTVDMSEFNLTGISKIYIDVEDYATNCTTIEIPTSRRLMGDVNNDGRITPLDASLALQANAKLIVIDDASTLAADVNGDGRVTPVDAMLILRQNAKLLDYEFGYVEYK